MENVNRIGGCMNNKMYEKGIQAQVCYEDLLDKLGERP